MNKFLKSSIFTSIMLFFLGLLLIFKSQTTIEIVSYIIGAVLIAAGSFALFRYLKINKKGVDATELDILYGIVSIILGILVITNPHAIASILPIVLGIVVIVSSAGKIQYAFNLKEENNEVWKATMLIALVSTLCGVILLFNPFAGAILIMRIVGIFILVYAILDIVSTYIIKKNVDAFKAEINNDIVVTTTTVDAEILEEKENAKKNKKSTVTKKKGTTRKSTTSKNTKNTKKSDK